MTSPATTERLYIDSSSLLLLMLGQAGHERVEDAIGSWEEQGGRVVSSRLLWLEIRRVTVREATAFNNDIQAVAQEHLGGIDQVPITEDVWARAEAIEQHIKSLDAIHLASCELAGASLLTAAVDGNLAHVATQRGVPVVD